tara:strand:- start:8879 stop:9571 length:693 start_codon:yes stop_codon:yes gene_type:complete
MVKKTNRLLIIPARSGSKRIKNKNIINFAGKPIIFYSIEAALKSKLFNKIHISSDSSSILKLCEKKKIFTEFLRPKNLANSKIGLDKVIMFVFDKFKKQNIIFDEYWCILPCSPLINKTDLIESSKIFNKDSMHPLMTFSKFPVPVDWAYKKKGNKFFSINPSKTKINSQNFPSYFYETGNIYIYSLKHLKNKYQKNIFSGYELKRENAIDIDEKDDLDFAKKLYSLKNI